MGQGAHTGLAMLLADEKWMQNWQQVKLEQSTLDAIYNNPGLLSSIHWPFQPNDHGFSRRRGHPAIWSASSCAKSLGLAGKKLAGHRVSRINGCPLPPGGSIGGAPC